MLAVLHGRNHRAGDARRGRVEAAGEAPTRVLVLWQPVHAVAGGADDAACFEHVRAEGAQREAKGRG